MHRQRTTQPKPAAATAAATWWHTGDVTVIRDQHADGERSRPCSARPGRCRRADKLGADVAAVQDPTIQELAAQASSSIDQLVHQLMRLDQQAQRTRRAAGRRVP